MANISTSTNTINRSIQTRKRMLNTPTIQEYLIVRAITPAASNTAPGTEKNKPSNEGLSGTAFRSIQTLARPLKRPGTGRMPELPYRKQRFANRFYLGIVG